MKTLWNLPARPLAALLASLPLLWLSGACERQSSEPEPAESATATDASDLPEADISGLPEGLQARLRRLQQAVRLSPKDPDQWAALGAIYYIHGLPEAAATCFGRTKQLAPRTMRWWYYLALACQRAGEREKAVNAYERALELNANYGPLYVRLARLLVESDRRRAVGLCRRALELDPKDSTAMLTLALCEEAAGDATAALTHIKQTLQIMPDYGEAHVAAARILTSLNRQQEAQQHHAATARGRTPLVGDQLFEWLLRNGMYLDVLLRDALFLAERGLFEQAEQALAMAREVDRTGVATGKATGMARVMQGRLEEAAEDFRRVLAARPDALDVKVRLADVQARLGQHEEAEAGFQAVLEQQPGNQYALERYCDLLLGLERGEEAEKLLRETADRLPPAPWIHLQLGIVLFNMNKDDDARQQFQVCLDMSPDYPRARYFLGRLAQRAGDLAGAKQQWERIVETSPDSLDAHLALAETAMQEHDFVTAERYIRNGLKHAPHSAGLTNGLAWILATSPNESQRNGQEAVRLAERACEATQRRQHELLDTLAAAYAEVGRFDDAVKTIREAVRLADVAGNEQAAATYQQRLTLYEKKQPYRDTK